MELDNLKKSWNSVSTDLNRNEFDIIAATKKEMETPLTKLKNKSIKQTRVLPIIFAFLVVLANKVPGVSDHLLIWMAFITLPIVTIYYYFNIRLINELEVYNGAVKADLQNKTEKLVRNNQLYLIFTRITIIAVVIVAEILIQSERFNYVQGINMLKSIIFPLRLLIYIGLIGIHYFVSKYTYNLYFGKYLTRLNTLLVELQ